MLPLGISLPYVFCAELERMPFPRLLLCAPETFRRALAAAILVAAETGVVHEKRLSTGTNQFH
jgi:hypothetical protein